MNAMLMSVCKKPSFVDGIRFCKLLDKTAFRLEHQRSLKKNRTLHWLLKVQIGHGALGHDNITNLCPVELTDIQKNILCHRLDF